MEDLVEVVGEAAHEHRVGHDRRRAGTDARPRDQGLPPARKRQPDLDETVAGVVEIAAADRDIVVKPRRRRRIDGEQCRRQGFVEEFLAAVVGAEARPLALAPVVDRALVADHRVGLAARQNGRPVNQPLGRGESQADPGKFGCRADVAHAAEVDRGARDEVRAGALQRLRFVVGELDLCLDLVPAVAGAPGHLAVGDLDPPRHVCRCEAVPLQQLKRQRPERAPAGDGKDLEERRHRADALAVLEDDLLRRVHAGDPPLLVDLEGRRTDDASEAKRVLRIVLDRVVVERPVGRAEAADGEGRQDAQFGDAHGSAPLVKPRPARMVSTHFRAS